jgi:phage terminase Nu1 subunit (DNA packaging protein)
MPETAIEQDVPKKPGNVGPEQLAKLFDGVTTVYISMMVKEGMPKEERGEYNVARCVLWYVRYLKRKIKEAQRSPREEDARIRHMEARAQMAEAEAHRAAQELITVADVKIFLESHFGAMRSKLLAIPKRAAPLLVGRADLAEIESSLHDMVIESLEELKEIEGHYNETSPQGKN